MEGQMTIFDIMGDFATMTDEEITMAINQKLGIQFAKEVLPKGCYRSEPAYVWKHKGLSLELIMMTDCEGRTMISTEYRKGTAGGGAPCYSIDEAVRYFKRILEREG